MRAIPGLVEPGAPGEVRARDRRVAMDRAQNERPVVLAGLLGVGAGEVDRLADKRNWIALRHPFTAPAVIALRINR